MEIQDPRVILAFESLKNFSLLIRYGDFTYLQERNELPLIGETANFALQLFLERNRRDLERLYGLGYIHALFGNVQPMIPIFIPPPPPSENGDDEEESRPESLAVEGSWISEEEITCGKKVCCFFSRLVKKKPSYFISSVIVIFILLVIMLIFF